MKYCGGGMETTKEKEMGKKKIQNQNKHKTKANLKKGGKLRERKQNKAKIKNFS